MQKSDIFKPISVLVISPHSRIQGGVAAFCETLKKHLKHCRTESLHIGNRGKEKENNLIKAVRLVLALQKLVFLVSKQDFDIIHINPSLNWKSLLRDGVLFCALKAMRCRNVLVYFHGWEWAVESRIRGSAWTCRVFAALLNQAKYILVLAPDFRQSLINMGVAGKRIACTCTMFDGSVFDGAALSGPSFPTILYLSRFDAQKGIYELLAAFARFANEFPDARLIFAGDGIESKRLRMQADAYGIGSRISFPGYVQGREKAELLLGCDIFTLPTYCHEGMPVALLEAMAAGKPLLTARAGGIGQIIREPENGIVLNEVTEASVTDGLRRLLRDNEFRRKAGAYNRAYAWENFEAGIVAERMERIYHDIAGKSA